MTTRRLTFRDHSRELGDNRYVYAVVSRRAQGLSIGINLNPDKVCNFDCPYCQVDRTPAGLAGLTAGVEVRGLVAELDRLLNWVADGTLWEHPPFDTTPPALRRVADIAFAGDGEPTSSRAFVAAAEQVHAARCRFGLDKTPIRLLTNATLLHRASVQAGLQYIDDIWAKLDAGTEAWFQLVDGTTFPFERILKNLTELARERPITLQSMFPAVHQSSPSDDEITSWLDRIVAIRAAGGTIAAIQVYTVARDPSDPTFGPLPVDRLEEIASRARALGFDAQVY